MDTSLSVGVALIGLFVFVLLLLVGRELVAWYFKTNEALAVLRSIDARLATLQNAEIRAAAERANASRAA